MDPETKHVETVETVTADTAALAANSAERAQAAAQDAIVNAEKVVAAVTEQAAVEVAETQAGLSDMAKFNSDTARAARAKAGVGKRSDGVETVGSDGSDYVDPVAAGNAAGEPQEPGKRGPGRPAGSGGNATGGGKGAGSAKTQSASLDLSSAIGLIQGFHAVVAMTRQEPHWLVNDADAKRYGAALANAARHFPMRTTQKALDIGVLIFCIVQIETPRVVMSSQLAKAKQQPPRGPAQVFQFRPPQPSGPSSPIGSAPPSNGAQPPMAEAPGPDPSTFDGALGPDPAA